MDLLRACEAFVSVADRGSFTRGAAAAGSSQSVASRRVAALEQHLGGTLLDRSGRAPRLTLLGRRLLPTARRLVEIAQTLVIEAEETRAVALVLAVPGGCDPRDLADVELAGLDDGVRVVVEEAGPHRRDELLARGQVAAAVVATPASDATWRVPLGVAGAVPSAARLHLDLLRPGRGEPSGTSPRLWLLEEDDVPHVRDPLARALEAAGVPSQRLAVAGSAASALASVLASHDLLVGSRADARRLDLAWRPLAAPSLSRGYAIRAGRHADAVRLTEALLTGLGTALGDPETAVADRTTGRAVDGAGPRP